MNKYFYVLACLCTTLLSIQIASADDLCTYPDHLRISSNTQQDIHLIGELQVSGSAHAKADSDNRGFVISGSRDCYGTEESYVTATIGIDQMHQCTITIHNYQSNNPILSQSNCNQLVFDNMMWASFDHENYNEVYVLWFSPEALTPKK